MKEFVRVEGIIFNLGKRSSLKLEKYDKCRLSLTTCHMPLCSSRNVSHDFATSASK